MTGLSVKIEQLSFGYRKEKKVFDNFNLEISGNETVGIIGANGAGKSTLLKLLVGLNLNYEGSIAVDGIKVERKTLSEIRRKTGYVFQDADNQLFMTSVWQDVAFAPENYGLSKQEVQERTEAAINAVNIDHIKNKSAHELSGGEKKLASIATILSMTPQIILLDEPSIALDPKNRRNLINILNGLDQLKIITSHDLDFVWDTCSRLIIMKDGKITADGKTDVLLRNEQLLEENGLELPLSLTRR